MIVLNLTDCPVGLRGDLTKWLMEVSAGVFVGQVSTRVREGIWERVVETCRNGRAILVYNTSGEQRLDFKVHGDVWEPIDFDGIKLMLRPSPARLKTMQKATTHSFSNAAKNRTAKRFSEEKTKYPVTYVVIDVETTGLDSETNEIIEIGAIKVIDHNRVDAYQSFVLITEQIPHKIEELTGITAQMITENGKKLYDVLNEFFAFLGDLPIVAHNADFDTGFLLQGCIKCNIPLFSNRCIDTQVMARCKARGLESYKLSALAAKFEIAYENPHRSLGDCEVTRMIYEKLIDFSRAEIES
jgi:CRISPR-associated protein Cas2